MTYALSNEEKISIIEQHVRNLEYSKFNLETALIAERALTSPDSGVILSTEAKLGEINTKITALTAEIATLQPPIGE